MAPFRDLLTVGDAPFEAEPDTGLLWRVGRYTSIQGRQGAAVPKRWLIRNYETGEMDRTYWGIRSSPQRYNAGLSGYTEDLTVDVLSKVRTDPDSFTDPETAALQTWANNLTGTDTPPTLPAPTPADEQAVRCNLHNSHKRSLMGRGRIVW